MPAALRYPGVYVEEIPSGVRTITGVATSIAAFVGWAPKGPTDRAELILSWPDFDRKFGGLDARSLLGYSVYQFFANGGQIAYVVRLVTAGSDNADDNAQAASVKLDVLKVTALGPGAYGNDYAIVTKHRTDGTAEDQKRFQLQVVNIKQDKKGVPIETFENLSINSGDPRFVINVLADESRVVKAELIGTPTDPPKDTDIPKTGEIPDAAKLAKGQDGKPVDVNAANTVQPTSGAGGVYYLDRIDLFNLLCVPGLTDSTALGNLQKFCRDRRAFLVADCPQNAKVDDFSASGPSGALTGDNAINAAFYFPWVRIPDPLQENRPRELPPCGFVAGIYARTDTNRGVWKAPAGSEASLTGVLGVKTPLTNDENGVLNPKAVNCIRTFPVYGTVIWGSRTLQGNDERGSEWKYVPVRRMALFIEETLYRATQWVVFEPNDEPLWAQIRLNIGAFMQGLFRQGAFQGKTPQESYFVKCDKETTTQDDINKGIVNIVVGFAPLKPAEFVVIKIQQIAGQIPT
jgi:phage tail sheath protein FI